MLYTHGTLSLGTHLGNLVCHTKTTFLSLFRLGCRWFKASNKSLSTYELQGWNWAQSVMTHREVTFPCHCVFVKGLQSDPGLAQGLWILAPTLHEPEVAQVYYWLFVKLFSTVVSPWMVSSKKTSLRSKHVKTERALTARDHLFWYIRILLGYNQCLQHWSTDHLDPEYRQQGKACCAICSPKQNIIL